MGQEEAVGALTVDTFGFVKDTFVRYRAKLYSWRNLSWMILLCASINVILIGGKRRAFGIFVSALHAQYVNTTMTELNWIGDSYAALGFFLMPFITTIIMRINRGYREAMLSSGLLIFISCFTSAAVPSPGYLFFTHTILHGVGSALILCTTALVTGEYFDKTHRLHVLATAFVSGGPYGVLIFGPLFSLWIHEYGWRHAFQICGCLFLIANFLAAIFFYPKPKENYSEFNSHASDSGKKESIYLHQESAEERGWAFCSIAHIKKNKQIILWAIERFIHNIVMYGLLMNLTTFATEALDNKIQQGSKVNLYFGVGESVIFTAGALIGDRIRGQLPLAFLIGSIFAAIFLLIVQNMYNNITALFILSGFLGAAVGSGNTFLYATTEEVMLLHGSIAFPMTKMIAGVGMFTAPLLSGAIIDSFTFRGFFISMTVLVWLRVILLIVINIMLWRKKIQKSKLSISNSADNGQESPADAPTVSLEDNKTNINVNEQKEEKKF